MSDVDSLHVTVAVKLSNEEMYNRYVELRTLINKLYGKINKLEGQIRDVEKDIVHVNQAVSSLEDQIKMIN